MLPTTTRSTTSRLGRGNWGNPAGPALHRGKRSDRPAGPCRGLPDPGCPAVPYSLSPSLSGMILPRGLPKPSPIAVPGWPGTAVGSVYPPVQPDRAGPASYCHGRGELSACPVGSTAVIEPPRPRGPLDLPGGLWGSTHSSGSLFGAACLAGRHCRRKRLPARATRQSRARFLLPRAGRRGGRLPAPGRPLNRSSRHAPIAFTLIWQLFIWPIPDFVSTPL